MPAPNNSGRAMSAWSNATMPALKLMKVLTTATEASAIPVAAGIPSSRTRPEDWRVKRPWPATALPPIELGVVVLAMLPSPDEREQVRPPHFGAFQNHMPTRVLRQG